MSETKYKDTRDKSALMKIANMFGVGNTAKKVKKRDDMNTNAGKKAKKGY